MINSMGDAECRPAYRREGQAVHSDHKDEMCEDRLERAEINPLPVHLTAKMRATRLSEGCSSHFLTTCVMHCRAYYEQVKAYLTLRVFHTLKIQRLFAVSDYHTRTVLR